MLWRASLLSLLFAAALGCAPSAAGGCLLDSDGGLDDAGFETCAPSDVDRESVQPPADDPDSGTALNAGAEAVDCVTLVEDVCGAGDPPPCERDSSCAAAKLLQRYEPSACEEARANDVTYPKCRPGPCALLVDRVCGGSSSDAACREAPGCEPSRVLHERSSSSDAEERSEAEASCNAALEDDVVFAPCQ